MYHNISSEQYSKQTSPVRIQFLYPSISKPNNSVCCLLQNSQSLSVGIKSTMAQGCRTGPPAFSVCSLTGRYDNPMPQSIANKVKIIEGKSQTDIQADSESHNVQYDIVYMTNLASISMQVQVFCKCDQCAFFLCFVLETCSVI